MTVRIPRLVYEGIEAVRQSGRTNMLDRTTVQRLCMKLSYYNAVVWLELNKREYAKGIFEGFEVEE